VLANVPEIAGKPGWIFTHDGRAPIGGFSKSKRQFDAKMQAELRKDGSKAKLGPWVVHDLRRTARSLMSWAGVSPRHAEMALGHAVAVQITGSQVVRWTISTRWLYDRRQLKEAKTDIKAWIEKWQARYSKLVAWVEDNIEETPTYYRLPLAHHRNMKSTNMLERFNEEIRRRTRIARIFPNEASCLRLVRALAVEQHERWQEDHCYLNMAFLKEAQRERLKTAA
jgi:Transposase, Mutator family